MMTIPLPVVLENGGKYVAAWCPILDIATQGKNEREARENMGDLIKWYFEDKDTPKPSISTMMNISVSLTNIPVPIPKKAGRKNEAACSVMA